MKIYFSEESEDHCYSKDYFEKGKILFEAKRVTKIDMFFCKAYGEVGEKGNCGKECEKYKPRNGKNGICNHNGYLYEKTDKQIINK